MIRTFCFLLALSFPATRIGSVSAQTLSFAEISGTAGIRTGAGGTGVSTFDFDQDGWDDITIALSGLRPALFRNNHNNTFTNIAESAGIVGAATFVVVLWADVNRDALPDLFVGQAGGGRNALYVNRGDGTFLDVAENAGIDVYASVGSAAFADFDENGYVDLFIAVNDGPDLLYRNMGNLRFDDVSEEAGIQGPEGSGAMQGTWVDYERDGDLDLFVVHGGMTESRLYINDGNLPMLDGAGTANISDPGSGNSMGVAWGDVDGDGWLDAYVSRIGRAGLYMNTGIGRFREEAEHRGADRNGMSWGSVFADFDNDGDIDLFVVSTGGTPTLLFENTDGFFSEVAEAAGISVQIESRGLATGDFNNDGALDIVMTSDSGSPRVFLNTTNQPGNWFKVKIYEPNHTPVIGARVEVVAGGRKMIRYIGGGDSFCSQSSATLHFGIGDVSVVQSVVVTGRRGSSIDFGVLSANITHQLTTSLIYDAVEDDARVPAVAILHQNYPNPFNPETVIRFELASSDYARLVVLDVLGRRVSVLVDEVLSAGSHQSSFDASDLPSGIYVYRLMSGTGIQTRLLSVVK
ncbi:MAG: VCBS repeat-containing protein [Bacteroidetes bacterium]|nr:VCBS repeat-containing protein [Bacteroidota bacterium]